MPKERMVLHIRTSVPREREKQNTLRRRCLFVFVGLGLLVLSTSRVECVARLQTLREPVDVLCLRVEQKTRHILQKKDVMRQRLAGRWTRMTRVKRLIRRVSCQSWYEPRTRMSDVGVERRLPRIGCRHALLSAHLDRIYPSHLPRCVLRQ